MDALAVDVDLSRALSRNDKKHAATLLVTHFASDVFALCRAIVRDRDVAEDLAQDAFQKALVALPSFRGDSSSRTWLLAIARNTCLDHLRRVKGSPFAKDDDGESDAHASTEAPILDVLVNQEDVERALAPLDPMERAIVVLFHGHGVGYPELAQAFGVKEGALRMRMSRATQRMREALASEPARTGREVSADFVMEEVLASRGRSAPRRALAPAVVKPAAPAMARAPAVGGAGPAASARGTGPATTGAPPRSPSADGAAPAPMGAPPAAPFGQAPPPPQGFGAPPPPSAAPAPAKGGVRAPSPGSLGAPAAPAPPAKGGLMSRIKSVVLGVAAAEAGPAAPPSVLHDAAPKSLVDRLLTLARAQ